MAVDIDLNIINQKLDTFDTTNQKISYLKKLIFIRKKALIEFESHDLPQLERLRKKTKKEYERYQSDIDNGRLTYIQPNDDSLFAKRMRLEGALKDLITKHDVLIALLDSLTNENLQQQTNISSSRLVWTASMQKLCSVVQQLIYTGYIANTQEELKQLIQYNIEGANQIIIEPRASIIWKGQKNQLYHVLRQLKDAEFIISTYDELVDFMHDAITIFQNSNKETTRAAFKRNDQPPKPRRIKLDL